MHAEIYRIIEQATKNGIHKLEFRNGEIRGWEVLYCIIIYGLFRGVTENDMATGIDKMLENYPGRF